MSQNVSCSQIYDRYGGQSMSAAATKGVMQGLTGMLGLGGFWKPVDDSALSNIENSYNELKGEWAQAEAKYQYKLQKWQTKFQAEQLQLLQAYNNFGDEMLSEQIGQNSLYIAVIFVALLIVIIYLIVL